MLSPFFVEPPPRPISTPAPEPPKAEPSAPAPAVPVVANASEQLDLKTGFEVSSVPKSRDYVFNVTLGRGNPDGFDKSMIFVNGQSPGPLIEANTGDIIRIVVNNQLPEESTTIHWHGIDQRNSNWMDGVHGVTQCAIPPGQSFTYEFNVTGQRGTFWYHSHDSLQYTNGLYGPLVIHDPDEKVPHIDDDKVVMFGDFFHVDAEVLLGEYLKPGGTMAGVEAPPDNIIINGHHQSNCTLTAGKPPVCTAGSLYKTRVQSGKHVRLRLVSHSTSTPFLFSIDSHTLQIIEIDGVEVEPIAATRVFMNPGQRYSVLVTTNQTAGNYKMHVAAARSCFHMGHGTSSFASVNYEAIGILSYDDTDLNAADIGKPWDLFGASNNVTGKEPWESQCRDLPFNLPKPIRKLAAYEVGERNNHSFTFSRENVNGTVRTYINEILYEPLLDDAVLWRVNKVETQQKGLSANWTFGADQFVMVSQDVDKGVQIVVNSNAMMMHPFHLHGQQFQIVGWGPGIFGEGGETTWNLENPMRRDTVTVPGYTHVVLRIRGDNPGVWALHCHILWHAEDGMFVQIAQRMDELENQIKALDGPNGQHPFRGRFCTVHR
ncbi:multicopper oxidase-domain-containing protein [Cercophora newfieldiana]|uniref:Multicopper oxidase-domain-containing protein n=1 Tax=Cercophora newfieldiana TaxID=92897 RepID=A0AA39YLT0_9PEZI|nr:multicopper oxidase-domain-containing protein [Cercophora newfieldiana]